MAGMLLMLGGTGYAAGRPPTAARNVQRAAVLVGNIPESKLARGRRAVVLGKAKRAAQLVRTKRTCLALAAADDLQSALKTPTTWQRGRIPRVLIAKPVALLASAEKSLLGTAGSQCAMPVKDTIIPTVQRGGQGFKPLPPPTPRNEQGGGPPLAQGTFQPPTHIAPITIGGGAFGGLGSASDTFAHAASQPLSSFRVADIGIPPHPGHPG